MSSGLPRWPCLLPLRAALALALDGDAHASRASTVSSAPRTLLALLALDNAECAGLLLVTSTPACDRRPAELRGRLLPLVLPLLLPLVL